MPPLCGAPGRYRPLGLAIHFNYPESLDSWLFLPHACQMHGRLLYPVFVMALLNELEKRKPTSWWASLWPWIFALLET